MKTIIFYILAFAFFSSCSSGGGDQQQNHNNNAAAADTAATDAKASEETKSFTFSDVYPGMPEEQVLEYIGRPSRVDTLNPSPETPIQDWWYDSNRKIRMMNGKVNRVVKDVQKEREIMQKIVEAKKNNDEKEMKRLEQQLIEQSY